MAWRMMVKSLAGLFVIPSHISLGMSELSPIPVIVPNSTEAGFPVHLVTASSLWSR
jgi:hypothetical protein